MTRYFVVLTLLTLSILLVPDIECLKKKKKTVDNNCGVTDLNPRGNYTLPKGYVAYPDILFAYKVHLDDYRTWTKSEKICVQEGGHLATIDSEQKLKYALHPPIPRFLGIRHVGIHLGNGDWVSAANGTYLRHIPWARGNPVYSDNKLCAAISHAPRYRRIMTVKCEDQGDFVCEIQLPEKCPQKKVEKNKPCVECNAYNFNCRDIDH